MDPTIGLLAVVFVSALAGAALVVLWLATRLTAPADGIKVLRLWSVVPRLGWPEIAILWLSDERHREFLRDAREFFNRYKIFPREVREATGCDPQTRKPAPQASELPGWLVVSPHWPDSGALYASFELWWPTGRPGATGP